MWHLSLGASARLEAPNERLFLLRPVNRSFFVVCVGWQVRALRVLYSVSSVLSLHSFDEVQLQVNGPDGWSKVSRLFYLQCLP